MMTREQRIDYEILDCALNGSRGNGYSTTVREFLKRLRIIFPRIVAREFTEACKRLSEQQILHLHRFDQKLDGFRAYEGARDDMDFFDDACDGFFLRANVQSQKHFRQLSVLIEAPIGSKRKTRPDR